MARVLALSSLVALITASFSLQGVISGAVPSAQGGGEVLVSAFLAGVGSLMAAWLVPLWVLTAAGAFVVSLDSARAISGTTGLLDELGGDSRKRSAVLAARAALLAAVSFVLGVSLGIVASQVVFRVVLVLLGAPYYVPALSPTALGLTALLSLSALLLGSGASAAFGLRRGSA